MGVPQPNGKYRMIWEIMFTASLVMELVFGASEGGVNSISFSIEGIHPKIDASISCSEESFNHIVNAYGYKNYTYSANEMYILTNTEMTSLENECNCKDKCSIPNLDFYRAATWTLVVKYKCKASCTKNSTSISVTPSMAVATIGSTVADASTIGTDSSSISRTNKSRITTIDSRSSKFSTADRETTVTNTSTKVTKSSTVDSLSATSKLTSNNQNDRKSKIIAAVVTVTVLAIASGVFVFIFLYRRRIRRPSGDAMYNNGPNATRRNDGFTNTTYNKESANLKLQSNQIQDDTSCSNPCDGECTDIHNEATTVNDNDMIQESLVSNSDEAFEDQYYVIKDDLSTEYNVIAFKSKDVPSDPNYGHTFETESRHIETYDRTGVTGGLRLEQSQEGISEYTCLHQGKQNNAAEAKNDALVHQVESEANEKGDDADIGQEYFTLVSSENETTSNNTDGECHNYFVLRERESQSYEPEAPLAACKANEEPNDYFVLSEEETVTNGNGDSSVTQPNAFDDDTTSKVPDEAHKDENTYFETPLSEEFKMNTWTHQYMHLDLNALSDRTK